MHPASDPNCPFCKIISGEYSSYKLYEDDNVLAVLDINPAKKGHVLIMPKNHFPIMPVIPPDEFKHLVRAAKKVSEAVRKRNVEFNSNIFIANGGVAGQQSAHFLMHIIPGKMYEFELKHAQNQDIDVYSALKNNLNIMMMNHSKREDKNLVSVETDKLFETDVLVAKIPDKVAAKGHIEVRSDKELTLSEVEDFFYLCSYASTAVFEYLGAHGSNIIIDERDNRMTAQIIPRFQGDGLNFMWTPHQGNPQELENVKSSIQYETIGLDLKDPVLQKKIDVLPPTKETVDPANIPESVDNFISRKIGKNKKASIFG